MESLDTLKGGRAARKQKEKEKEEREKEEGGGGEVGY